MTASKVPRAFTCLATSRQPAMLLRSPATASSAPGTAVYASLARWKLRACSTTWWPSATSNAAAICPNPSAEPVMNTFDIKQRSKIYTMGKIISVIHTSLDGFVADAEKQISWIRMNEEIHEFVMELCRGAAGTVYGRTT